MFILPKGSTSCTSSPSNCCPDYLKKICLNNLFLLSLTYFSVSCCIVVFSFIISNNEVNYCMKGLRGANFASN